MSIITPEPIQVQMPHITLRGLQWGNPNAERVIVSLHGWLDNVMTFSRLAPLLANEHVRLLALDLAGHGMSDHRPLRSGYHFTDYIRDTYLALEQLNIHQFDFVCHSLGAAIATLYAGSFPQQVNRFVAIECYGLPFTSDDHPLPERMAERIPTLDVMRSRSERVYPDLQQLIRARQQAGYMDASSAELILHRNLEETPEGYRFVSDRRLTTSQPMLMSEAQLHTFLKRITADVLVIEAESGLMPHWHALAQRYDATPTITVKRLAGGHHLHLDDPEPVAAAIGEYMSMI